MTTKYYTHVLMGLYQPSTIYLICICHGLMWG